MARECSHAAGQRVGVLVAVPDHQPGSVQVAERVVAEWPRIEAARRGRRGQSLLVQVTGREHEQVQTRPGQLVVGLLV